MIPALVLRKNFAVDFLKDGVIGDSIIVPSLTDGAWIDGDYYAVPVNFGVYTGWNFVPYNPADSPRDVLPLWGIPVTKLSMTNNSDTFIIVGTSAQYVTASGGGAALPTNLAYLNGTANPYSTAYRIHATDLLYAVQNVNGVDVNGNAAILLSVPPIPNASGLQLLPFGNVNGVEAYSTATLAGTSYASPASLLTFLQTHWATLNGVNITWTLSVDNLTAIGTITNFTTSVSFGGGIVLVNPSA